MTRDNPPCHDDGDDGDGDGDSDDDGDDDHSDSDNDEIHSDDWPGIYFYVPILILDNIHQVKELASTASMRIKHQKEKVWLTELDCEGLPVCQQDILAW